MTEDNNKDIRNILDLADGIVSFIEENQDTISDAFGGKGVSLSDRDPLKSIVKEDDIVIVTIETKDEVDEVGFKRKDGKVRFMINDKSIKVSMPEDARLGDAEAVLNNGVLEVKVPRGDE